MKVGIRVTCSTCGKPKAPHGRSVAWAMTDSLCSHHCAGYNEDPRPGCLWPGETAEDFGYHSCDHATEERGS